MTPIRALLAAALVAAPLVTCTTDTPPPPATPAASSADDFVGAWNIRLDHGKVRFRNIVVTPAN